MKVSNCTVSPQFNDLKVCAFSEGEAWRKVFGSEENLILLQGKSTVREYKIASASEKSGLLISLAEWILISNYSMLEVLSRSTCKLGWRRNMQSRKPLPIYSFLRRLFCPTWLIVNFGGLCLVLSLFSSGAARCRVYGRGGSKQPFKDVLDPFFDRNYHFF